MAETTHHTPVQTFLMFAAVAVTLVFGALIIRTSVERGYKDTSGNRPPEKEPPTLGVHANITFGDEVVERQWATLDIDVQEGQTIDEELPAALFAGDFIVTFRPGQHRRAYVGAMIQNGSVIVMRGDEVLLSDYAGPDAKLVLTRLPVWLPRRYEQIEYRFKSDAAAPVKMRAMWQPEGAETARPLG